MPRLFRVKGKRFKTVVVRSSKVHKRHRGGQSKPRKERSKDQLEELKEPNSDRSKGNFVSVSMDRHIPGLDDGPDVPAIHTKPPPLQDALETETSVAQNETIQECLPCFTGLGTRSLFDFNTHGVPFLQREKHIEYLHERLGDLPSAFVAYDAARPWALYWSLTGLCLLDEVVDQYSLRYQALHQ